MMDSCFCRLPRANVLASTTQRAWPLKDISPHNTITGRAQQRRGSAKLLRAVDAVHVGAPNAPASSYPWTDTNVNSDWRENFNLDEPPTMLTPTGHAYECTTCTMLYSWTRNEEGHVYLETRVSINMTHPLPRDPDPRVRATDGQTRKMWVDKWLKYSDPRSWGFTECKELKHVYWYADEDCITISRWTRLTQYLRDERV